MHTKLERLIQILFLITIVGYFFYEFPYDIEILLGLSLMMSINLLINGIRFRLRRNKLIELGQVERFQNTFLHVVYVIIVVGTIVFLFSKLNHWKVIPERKSSLSSSFAIIVLLPQLIRFILGVTCREMGEYLYITDHGLLKSMSIKESQTWKEFTSYYFIQDQNLLRLRKNKQFKQPKFLFISYHDEYFKEHEVYILSILDKNLKNEYE